MLPDVTFPARPLYCLAALPRCARYALRLPPRVAGLGKQHVPSRLCAIYTDTLWTPFIAGSLICPLFTRDGCPLRVAHFIHCWFSHCNTRRDITCATFGRCITGGRNGLRYLTACRMPLYLADITCPLLAWDLPLWWAFTDIVTMLRIGYRYLVLIPTRIVFVGSITLLCYSAMPATPAVTTY